MTGQEEREDQEEPEFTLDEITAAFGDLAEELEWREEYPRRLPLALLLARMLAERG